MRAHELIIQPPDLARFPSDASRLRPSFAFTTSPSQVYHPGSPGSDDGSLSWSTEVWPYFHAKGYSSKIADLPDNQFQDGMLMEHAVLRLHQIKNRTVAAEAAGQTPAPFFMAVGLHKVRDE